MTIEELNDVPGVKSFFGERDGIVHLSDRSLARMELNLRPTMNQHAVFSSGLAGRVPDTGGALIDAFFGYAYSGLPASGSAVYGPTASLLPAPLERFCTDCDFLRVPFKRIPKINVSDLKNLQEILQFVTGLYGSDRLLFRGQNQEYLLRRSPEFCQLFYGKTSVEEPSLLASAARRIPSIRSCMPELMMWVQLWQESSLGIVRSQLPPTAREAFNLLTADIETHWAEGRFYHEVLAYAQHYGLPSVGLDVTSKLSVALFFALRRFVKSEDGTARYVPVTPDCSPVIYILLKETTREYSFKESVHAAFHSGRPAAQDAWFVHVGWGLSLNTAAEQILAAVYLDPTGDFGEILAASSLFPNRDNDRLGAFLSSLGESASSDLKHILSRDLYWVADD